MTSALFFRRLAPLAFILVLTGCQAYRSRHDGQHLTPPRKHHAPSRTRRALQAEVTTDAAGAIAGLRVVRSSGSSAMDDFVLESIRSSWPPAPSQRTVVEVTHSPADGFSEPKVISTAPAP